MSTFWLVDVLVFDVLVCRRFSLSTFWSVDVSVCRRFGLSTFWFVDVLVCRRFGLSPFWFVAVSVCRRFGCPRFGLSTFWLVTSVGTGSGQYCCCNLLSLEFLYACKDCTSFQWRHNECDGVSNHRPHDCLLNRLFRRRSKKTSKLRVTGLCVGNSSVTGEFPAQRANNAENVSIWWRYHVVNQVFHVQVCTAILPAQVEPYITYNKSCACTVSTEIIGVFEVWPTVIRCTRSRSSDKVWDVNKTRRTATNTNTEYNPRINKLCPSNAILRQRSRSELVQVKVWCLMAPSHYLNQCWIILKAVLLHSHKVRINSIRRLCSEIIQLTTISLWSQWLYEKAIAVSHSPF